MVVADDAARRSRGISVNHVGLRERDWTAVVLATVVVVALVFAVIRPVVAVVGQGLNSEGRQTIGALFTSAQGRTVLTNTVRLGLIAGVLGTVIGFCQAFLQVFLPVRGKRILHMVALMPLISPPFALATATVTLFGRNGLLYATTGVDVHIYGLKGLVFVLALSFAPIAYMNLRGLMQSLDPSLFEAATNLGAGRVRVLAKVTLPLLLPGILSSFLLLFVEAIADLANPLVLGGDYQVLATQIYYAVTASFSLPAAAGGSIVLLTPAIIVFFLQRYWVARKSVVTVTGKSGGSSRARESLAVSLPIGTVAVASLLLIVAVYGLILVGSFTRLLGIDNSFTLANFNDILTGGALRSFTLTTVMAVVAAPLSAAVGLSIAWLVVRRWKKGPFAALLDLAGMLGSAVPGTVLGIGAALAFGAPTYLFGRQVAPQFAGAAAPLAGVIGIVLVYFARGIPTGQQAAIASLRQISPSIEEAATSLGASATTAFRRVSLPLIEPALVTALTYAVTRSMTVMTAIIFIVTPDTQVVTARTLSEVEAGRYGNAFAYCLLLIVVVLLLMGLIQLAAGALSGNAARRARKPDDDNRLTSTLGSA